MSSAFNVQPLPKYTRRNSSLTDDERLARVSEEAPRIPWDKFSRRTLQWKPGEHFGLIGPTGQGKTTMLFNLLPLHPYVVVFATKPRDKSMDGLIRQGYLKMDKWAPRDPAQFPRRVLWPDASRLDSKTKQRAVFGAAFDEIYREGGWTVALDEMWYMSQVLKMDEDIKTYLLQARSLGISLLMATQRPAWVPREMYTASTHLMFWRVNDETDLSAISGIGARSSQLIRETVMNLDPFQCLYVNTRTGFMCRTRCPEIKGI